MDPIAALAQDVDVTELTSALPEDGLELWHYGKAGLILVAAIGRAHAITAPMIKPGAAVIDVGINRTEDGLVGDVDFHAAKEVAGAITPVPGGVGPMTIAMLLANTVRLAQF